MSQWTADGGVAANGPIVAYSNFLIPGADPAPCNEWQFAVVQAKIVFDFSSIPSGAIIDRAVLKYAIRPVATRSRGFFETTRDCGRADSTFYAEMGTASSVPTGELSTGAPIPYASPATVKWERNPELNVRGRVQTARSSGTVSLLFSPKPTRANQQHDVTASMMGPVVYCASYADDFSLEIDIRVPVSG